MIDCVLETWSGQTKDYIIGISCFSANHARLRIQSTDWLAQDLDNLCCVSGHYENQLSMLV